MLLTLSLLFFISQGFCKDLVPVIIWGNYGKPALEGNFPGLSQLRSFHFSQLLQKLIAKRPHVLLFTEESLSIEDFSWRNDQDLSSFPNLRNLSMTNEDYLYLPSIESPVSVFRQLTHHGYSFANYDEVSPPVLSVPSVLKVTLPEPGLTDTRPALLHSHDTLMARIAQEAMEKYESVLVAYTGRHASFVEPSSIRRRRAAEEEEIVMHDDANTIFLVAAAPIELRQGSKVTNLTRVTYVSMDKSKGDTVTLDVRFQEEHISLDFTFNAGQNQAWQLDDILVEGTGVRMTSKTFVGAPDRYSFFCASEITFQGLSPTEGEYTLILRQLQAQPRVVNNEFGPASDCVPYFTSQIWTGLIISLMLIGVTLMSILFLLDIHTMDKFDDPKGKVITIPNE